MSVKTADYDCFYRLDDEDRILDWGGPNWNAFARENGGATGGRSLKGDLLYDHIVGHFTQRFLREFFAAARVAAAPLTRTYRCDSPRMKRLMEMRAQALGRGWLDVQHRLVAETPLPIEVAFREQPEGRRADYLRCSICNRLRRSNEDEWREPEEAGAKGELRVVHTVCSDCRNGLSAALPRRPQALS